MCCSRRMLGPPTQAGQPQLRELTGPIVRPFRTQRCHPRPALQRSREAGKRAPGGSSVMLINALSSTKFHQSSPTHRSKTILLCAFLFSSMYMLPTNVREVSARVMRTLEAVRTSGHCVPGCAGRRARRSLHLHGGTERPRCLWACIQIYKPVSLEAVGERS